jgi:transcriptional regulator with XRE-family HTH domain
MTPTDFRDLLKRNGLRQADAAYLAGVRDRQARAWALGENAISQSVALLLLAYDEGLLPPDWFARRIAGLRAEEKPE